VRLFVLIELIFLFSFLACLLLLFIQSTHKLLISIAAMRPSRDIRIENNNVQNEFPFVTIQLPMYNEQFVAHRVLEACAVIDYPKDRFEIQVVDDSDDKTCDIVSSRVNALVARGIQARIVHRDNRNGYKAGALAHATEFAKGEFIAIFDADFVPRPHCLRLWMPFFSDPQVGLVQARWEHLNKDDSLLTCVQSVLLDAHFTIEQNMRAAHGFFWNFNGTAGIWRRAAIADAGGWASDTLTEDMDLSYRAQLRGWKFCYLQNDTVPAELPADVASYLSQQRRWAKGGGQNARKLFFPIIKSTALNLRQKFEALIHLFSNHSYGLKFILIFMMPLYAVARHDLRFEWLTWFDSIVLLTNFISLFLFYSVATFRLDRPWFDRIVGVPSAILMESGLSLQKGLALAEGLTEFNSVFDRTAKAGDLKSLISPYYVRFKLSGWVELAMASWLITSMVLLNRFQMDHLSSFIFLGFSAFSFIYIGFLRISREIHLARPSLFPK